MSREIDALVAEHVMGLKEVGYKKATKHHTAEAIYAETHDVFGSSWPALVPRYSTDIASAWKVFLAVIPKGEIHNTFVGRIDAELVATWRCDIQTADFTIQQNANTPEMAICLAALRAKGIEVPE